MNVAPTLRRYAGRCSPRGLTLVGDGTSLRSLAPAPCGCAGRVL